MPGFQVLCIIFVLAKLDTSIRVNPFMPRDFLEMTRVNHQLEKYLQASCLLVLDQHFSFKYFSKSIFFEMYQQKSLADLDAHINGYSNHKVC